MKKIHILPNLITLGNAFCGLLALAKGIDARADEVAAGQEYFG